MVLCLTPPPQTGEPSRFPSKQFPKPPVTGMGAFAALMPARRKGVYAGDVPGARHHSHSVTPVSSDRLLLWNTGSSMPSAFCLR